jgi:mannose-1-phosphate guanylyltransferase
MVTPGKVIVRDAKNNLIYSNVDKKIVVVNDVNDIVVVDTKDALFISSLKNSADVKKVVEILKEKELDQYL